MTPLEIIEAAIARIHGEWDSPALLKFGALTPDTLADVLAILKGKR
jgi:hypothetical protein